MPFNIATVYDVNTPPIKPDKLQGMRISLAREQFRYCAFEGVSKVQLECGVFVTFEENAFGDVTFRKPVAATEKIAGVSFLNWQRPLVWDNVLQCYSYPANEQVTLMEEGDIVMYAESAVTYLDDVYVRIAADTGKTRIGALASAAGAGLTKVDNARFVEKITAPGRINVSLRDLV